MSVSERIAAAAVLVLVLAAACSSGGDGGAAPAPSTTVALHEVASFEETFVDEGRDRILRTVVHHPAGARAEAPFPLVLFSHGNTARPEYYERLLEAVAARGYVVAAPEYPKTGASATERDLFDVNHQPADASFVIDRVLALSARADGVLSGLVDGERVGAVGHSLGAITTLLLGWNTCCVDERVDAGVALAGAAVFGTADGRWFDGITTPLLFVHGDDDRLLGVAAGHQAYERAEGAKVFVTLVGGPHAEPFVGVEPWYPVVEGAVVDFLDAYVAGEPGALERLRRADPDPEVARIESAPALSPSG